MQNVSNNNENKTKTGGGGGTPQVGKTQYTGQGLLKSQNLSAQPADPLFINRGTSLLFVDPSITI
jgi:hypothetical protein